MKRTVRFQGSALEQLSAWILADKKTGLRIIRLIEECRISSFEGLAKPEPLKGNLSGYWSRRIDEEHRLIYEVFDNEIVVISMKGHY